MNLLQSLRSSIARGHRLHLPNAWNGTRPMSSYPRPKLNPLFNYTSGRWLWNEREQLEARCRYFNVPGLQQAACQATGTNICISLKNIAKIPHPNAGPPALTTSSEVATMEFARDILELPVPKVLAWSASNQNPVQAEYIIMEEARGSQLHEVWQDLPLRKKVNVMREFVEIEKKLLSISFVKFGSLYFRDSGIKGCGAAIVENAPQSTIDHIASRYCVGPITRREFWKGQRSEMHHHGPWTSSVEYLEYIAYREINWIKSYADRLEPFKIPWQYTSLAQRTPEAHTDLLRKFVSTIPLIVPQDSELVSSSLWHPDFHAGNIYVDDEARVSCIIDWQGAWTTPVFLGANPPLLLDYGIEMLMKLPDNFKMLDDATKDHLRYQISQSVLIHTSTAENNPVMHKVMQHPHGHTLKELEAFAGSTWDDGLFPLEECLIRVEREWDHFKCTESCPYHFSTDQIRQHKEGAEEFNKSQEFWRGLRGLLTDEGYTSHESFDTAVQALHELRAAGLRDLEGEERLNFDEKTAWIAHLDSLQS